MCTWMSTPLQFKCSDLHQIVSRILAIRKDKTFAFAFEADNIVCWLVNPPIAMLDLFKSADCRWISKSSAEYCYKFSNSPQTCSKSNFAIDNFFCGCPSDLCGKAWVHVASVTRLIVFLMNVPVGRPCVYVHMQLEIEPGTKKKKKLYGIKQYLREPAACRSMLP